MFVYSTTCVLGFLYHPENNNLIEELILEGLIAF